MPNNWREKIKKYALWIPAGLLLTVGNVVFSLVYLLPFVNKQRRRFEKEGRPLFYFKSPKSFVAMSLLFSLFGLLLTNYLVFVIRGMVGYLVVLVHSLWHTQTLISFPIQAFSFWNLFHFESFRLAPVLAYPIFCLFLVIAWRSAWINFEQYRNYNHNESGDDRFAIPEEIKRQYKRIPDRNKSFPGYGGIPVYHVNALNLQGFSLDVKMKFHNKKFSKVLTNAEKVLGLHEHPTGAYYIEDGLLNLIGVGMTRSGKGESQILTTIDIMSRAEEKASLIIGDPKTENYLQSYVTLRKRGYDVDVLSFQNMDWSMSYNPLYLAVEAAKRGYYEKTQQLINSVAEAIYRKSKPGNTKNKYWEDTAISLFNATALALIDRAKETKESGEKDAWDTVTIRNIAKFLIDLASRTVLTTSNGDVVTEPEEGVHYDKKSELTAYFDNLDIINESKFSKFREMAVLNFRQSDFAGGETKGNVYSNMMSGLNLYLQDNIAKLTSKNTIDLESIGNPRRISLQLKSSSLVDARNEYAHAAARITIVGLQRKGLRTIEKIIVDKETALIDALGYLKYNITPLLPKAIKIYIDFKHKSNEGRSIYHHEFVFKGQKVFEKKGLRVVKDSYTHQPILSGFDLAVVTQPEGSLSLQKEHLQMVYSEKPKAIFLATPPHKTEYNEIVSLFLDQVFNVNFESALEGKRQCATRIVHILDEFTNMPMIPKMDEKLSICLGVNIMYILWIQNLEQVSEKYGKEVAGTMLDNCSLKMYIKSISKDTNKSFSEDLGSKTITKRRRSGNVLDESNPNVAVDTDKQPLLTETQLQKLHPGEMVAIRGVKPHDRLGREITTDPIFATGRHRLPYRYMFLQDAFDSNTTLADIPVRSDHRYLELADIGINARDTLGNVIDWKQALQSRVKQYSGEIPKLATRQTKPQIQVVGSENYFEKQLSETLDAYVV